MLFRLEEQCDKDRIQRQPSRSVHFPSNELPEKCGTEMCSVLRYRASVHDQGKVCKHNQEVCSHSCGEFQTFVIKERVGGRGVISKYSGIETYYEEVGRRLAANGDDVTVYCRNYFTPAIARHNNMRLVRLPTMSSKHLETVIHTFLSTLHVCFSRCDVVHYHCLAPAL